MPSDSNTRRYGIVNFNQYSYEDHVDEFNAITSNLDYDDLLTTCLLSVPTTQIIKVSNKSNESYYDKYWQDKFIDNYYTLPYKEQVRLTKLLNSLNVEDSHSNRHSLLTFLIKQHEIKKYDNNRMFVLTDEFKNRINPESVVNTHEEIIDNITQCTSRWNKLLDTISISTSNTSNTNYNPEEHLTYVDNVYDKVLKSINSNQEFIVSAKYTEEYALSKPDRKAEHLQPTFFVYESDTLPIEEQRDFAINVASKLDCFYQATYSGSKSCHILIAIEPTQANDIKKDFKFYWQFVANKLFGEEYSKNLDSACASVGRLTRNPGAINSKTGKLQELICINEHVVPIDLSEIIKMRNRQQRTNILLKYITNNTTIDDTKQYLQNIYNKNGNEHANVALKLLNHESIPSGTNLIGCLGYLKKLGISSEDIRTIGEEMVSQHPSNISYSTLNKFV